MRAQVQALSHRYSHTNQRRQAFCALGVDHGLTFFEHLDWSVIHHEKVFAFID